MIKKFLSILFIILVTSFAFTTIMPSYKVSAKIPSDLPEITEDKDKDDTDKEEQQTTGNCDRSFLGLIPWNCNVTITDGSTAVNEDVLKGNIWQIAANVLSDIIIIATYLVLGYVIYGGYLYMFSGGDPGKVASGKRTLIHAFIGLAIVLLANVIMSTIRFILIGASQSLLDCTNPETEGCITSPATTITSTIQWAVAIAGVVAVIFVIYGGVLYITSSGEPGKTKKAKDTIIYSIIGLIVVALAEVITAFVTNIINTVQ